MSDRSGLKWVKLKRFISLMFQPESMTTYQSVSRFEDISIERLKTDGIEGVLIDADGTLGPDHARQYSDAVVGHVLKMKESGLKVAIFTNAREDRFHQFPGIPVVSDVPAKPAPEGFLKAMEHFLELENPAQVCMIGDNYLTDGGAVKAGMLFLYVEPIPGPENFIHKWTRDWAFKRCKSNTSP
ncbi:MAG: HAD hydrolase-like protein [Candidatus Nitronauta litoralis]|uniref:HAD hydrolase-like protein n=1 Tax=Candidatus Nitronauta litoralis TaxID=2705533 RepID=A0A7T0BZ50_9BACT|nr:MAG: HAD hydrolase-like protein [Candidatus Nitronauta litoralis]